MMEITGDGGQLSGQLTTRWYGPMEMQNVRPAGEGLQFELRNLNDKDHPTRTWTARMGSDGSIRLVGDIWYAHVEQSGTRGTAANASPCSPRPHMYFRTRMTFFVPTAGYR
jgi:alpha-galactosidase